MWSLCGGVSSSPVCLGWSALCFVELSRLSIYLFDKDAKQLKDMTSYHDLNAYRYTPAYLFRIQLSDSVWQ